MIQRIQSLWLLLISAALLAVLFLPIGIFRTPDGMYECTAFALKQEGSRTLLDWPVWLIGYTSIASAVLAFITIFLYKKRNLQMIFCWINALIMLTITIGFIAIIVYFKKVMGAWAGYGPGLLMPLAGLILDFLAIYGIRKDEKLVKSWDRIR
jgi:hypothetical protein